MPHPGKGRKHLMSDNTMPDTATSGTRPLARLLASSLHDLRNVLAVIRESAGLTADLLGAGGDVPRKERMLVAMEEIRSQVASGALLAEAMRVLASDSLGDGDETCDPDHVCLLFCCMAKRLAKGAGVRLAHVEGECGDLPVPATHLLRDLLAVLDACAAAGGNVTLRLGAGTDRGRGGVTVEVAEGDNAAAVAEALARCPLVRPVTPGLVRRLTPWRRKTGLFFLPVPTPSGQDRDAQARS